MMLRRASPASERSGPRRIALAASAILVERTARRSVMSKIDTTPTPVSLLGFHAAISLAATSVAAMSIAAALVMAPDIAAAAGAGAPSGGGGETTSQSPPGQQKKS